MAPMEDVLETVDIFVTTTGNKDIIMAAGGLSRAATTHDNRCRADVPPSSAHDSSTDTLSLDQKSSRAVREKRWGVV